MSTALPIQQRLRALCRVPTDGIDDDDELSLSLENMLAELDSEKKQYLCDTEDESGRAPLFHAIESGKSFDFLKQLLDYGARITPRILLSGIRQGNLEVLKLLKERGANFRETYHGASLLNKCILLHQNDLINYLIDEGGIDPNVVDLDNQTPLLIATFRSNIEAINILLRYPSVDPCAISTHKQRLTCFHAACELGIDEVLPAMIRASSSTHINKLSSQDQTPFDLFLSCYLFTKNSLHISPISLTTFSSLFDLFVARGAKLHHLTKAYRRTRAPYVTKILTIIFKKNIDLHQILLPSNRSTIFSDLQLLVCESLGDWPRLIEYNDAITSKQRYLILRQLYELFFLAHFKSNNRQPINDQLLTRHCFANQTKSRIRQIVWSLVKTYISNHPPPPPSLKSICRKQILVLLDSVEHTCIARQLEISADLEQYLLFFQ